MKFAVTILLSASVAWAASLFTHVPVNDTTLLQYALTLENLAAAFYHGALDKFDETAFENAGFPSGIRGRFLQLEAHGDQHVQAINAILGINTVAPCNYKFSYSDPVSFAKLASAIEFVGLSAYLGATPFFVDRSLVTLVTAILSVRARNQAWVSSDVNKQQPWSGAEDTPLAFSEVFSLITPYIVNCPNSQPELIVSFAAAGVTAQPPDAPSGVPVTYSFAASSNVAYYAHFHYGTHSQTVPLSNLMATVPYDVDGQPFKGTYVTSISTDPSNVNPLVGSLISTVNYPPNAN
jgi:hypothetical protein